MKYLKKFNENITTGPKKTESLLGLSKELFNSEITPPGEKVPIYNVYKAIIIKSTDLIDTTGLHHVAEVEGGLNYQTKWIYISLSQYVTKDIVFYPDEESLSHRVSTTFDVDFRDYPIIGYNDINFPEIETILNKWGIDVDEMWGMPVNN